MNQDQDMVNKHDLSIDTCLEKVDDKGSRRILALLIYCFNNDVYINTKSARGVLNDNEINSILYKGEYKQAYIKSIGNKRRYRNRVITRLGLVNLSYKLHVNRCRYAQDFIEIIKIIKYQHTRYQTLMKCNKEKLPLYFLDLLDYKSKKQTISNNDYIFWCLCNYLMERYKKRSKDFYENILDPLIFIDSNSNKKKSFVEFIKEEIYSITSEEFIKIYNSSKIKEEEVLEVNQSTSLIEDTNINPLTKALIDSFDNESYDSRQSAILTELSEKKDIIDIETVDTSNTNTDTIKSIMNSLNELDRPNINITININIINNPNDSNRVIEEKKQTEYKNFYNVVDNNSVEDINENKIIF